MEKLKPQTFKAKDWARPSIIVEGKLSLRDKKTLKPFDKTTNKNGFVVCIEYSNGYNVVDPDSVEIIN